MKLDIFRNEQDTKEMSDEYLEWKYYELISDQVVANAVMAVLLKLEIERRRDEALRQEAIDYNLQQQTFISFNDFKD